ncbi:MAG: MFS transporter [Spirochaetes bacterium]|nr:MFS transporter [Spirochaetota bacterium]
MKKFTSFNGRAYIFIIFLASLWFLNFAGRSIFSPILPLIEDEYLISHARATSILLFLSVGYGLSVFFSGFFSGVFGYKRTIMLSLIVSALTFFCIYFFKIFSAFYIFNFIIGVATGVYLPAALPIITHNYEEKKWSKAIAIHDSAASIGVFVVPIIAVFLMQFLEWRGIFSLLGIVLLIAVVPVYFFIDELKVKKISMAVFSSFIKNKSLWVLSLIWLFAASCSTGVFFIVPLYLTKELHMDIEYANMIFGISRTGGFAFALGAGFLAARFSVQKLMALVLILSGIFTVLVSIADIKFMAIALFFQASIIYGYFPLGLIAISRLFDINVRSIATGFVLGFGIIVGWGIAPYLLGLSGDHISFRFGIMILGILIILSSGLVYLLKDLQNHK